jgi:predicted aspartyl protease
MGFVYQTLSVKLAHNHPKSTDVEFLIDSGAVLSVVPRAVLVDLGIEPHRTLDFVLVDGTKLTRDVGDAFFKYQGEGGAAPVIFGEDGDAALLGVTTLESLALVLNPFKRELSPMKLLLI